jgi:hypothetical protein
MFSTVYFIAKGSYGSNTTLISYFNGTNFLQYPPCSCIKTAQDFVRCNWISRVLSQAWTLYYNFYLIEMDG